MNTKLCTKCNTIKSFDEYSKSKNRKYGIACHCKSCINLHKKEYRSKETAVVLIKESRSRYNKKNRDKNIEYRRKNKDRIAIYNKNHRLENKERYNQVSLSYKRKSIDEINDTYVKDKLKRGISLKGIDIPQEIIELKRIIIKTHRLCQQLQN
jgi:bisphosphoglycerate-independent phosphoglycerate mutase (AlkP superfamily)